MLQELFIQDNGRIINIMRKVSIRRLMGANVRENKFSGIEIYKNMERINWEGEFVDRVYESKGQKRLQAERAIT